MGAALAFVMTGRSFFLPQAGEAAEAGQGWLAAETCQARKIGQSLPQACREILESKSRHAKGKPMAKESLAPSAFLKDGRSTPQDTHRVDGN